MGSRPMMTRPSLPCFVWVLLELTDHSFILYPAFPRTNNGILGVGTRLLPFCHRGSSVATPLVVWWWWLLHRGLNKTRRL